MNKKEKAYLEILIGEIKGIIKEAKPEDTVQKIGSLIDSWVVQNDLHPENVKVTKLNLFLEKIKIK